MPTASQIAILGEHFESFRGKLERMVSRRLDSSWHDRIEPADIVMEAYLRGHKRWLADPSKTHMAEYWWWYRLTLDRLIEEQRRLSATCRDVNRNVAMPTNLSRLIGDQLRAALTTPSRSVSRREAEAALRQAIDGLKEEYREILWMRYFEKLSFEEIARVMELTPNAVQKRHARAIARLADEVDIAGQMDL